MYSPLGPKLKAATLVAIINLSLPYFLIAFYKNI